MEKENIKSQYIVTLEDKKNAIEILNNAVFDSKKRTCAILLLENIDNKLILDQFIKLASNSILQSSDCYERVLTVASFEEYVKSIIYIGYITCSEKFLNSEICELGLELLEIKTPKTEYQIYFQLQQCIEKPTSLDMENLKDLKAKALIEKKIESGKQKS